jgi:Protein of unknown function (DUF1592)/Protein of unknown function (DUF1588)/Protein of unknown function (DUF1595)/Protein of unknown function (DUF1585)/Protein of unknown function (DUF1587)
MKPAPRVYQPYSAIAVLGLVGLCSLACSETGTTNPGGAGSSSTGGTPGQGGSASTAGTAGVGAGGDAVVPPADLSKGGPKLRVLTRTEFKNSVNALLGPVAATLDLPPDLQTAGFASIGGGELSLNSSSVKLYEAAARAAAAEVFADSARWQKLVGCQPKADLSDACVGTFIQTFGKRAFRRALSAEESQQWLKVGTDGAAVANSAALALGNVVSGMLQSPNFLYRIETNKLDDATKRLWYDGQSMATRLAYVLTGTTPSDALLDAAASGQLATADGVKTAIAPLLTDSKSLDRMAEFFTEYSQAELINIVEKAPNLFPTFNDATRVSMLQATNMFIKNVVLAPGADVRTFFDSDQTFVDSTLAAIYGVAAPASGFQQIKLGPESGRAGILGQSAVIAGHAQADHTSPTRRGVFITGTFLCRKAPDPPPGVNTVIPPNDSLTQRQKLEAHRADPKCAGCHALFDPYGLALEHLDPIGKYRSMEGGLPIDATGALDGVNFDGVIGLGTALRGNASVMRCMVSNFYRNANGVPSDTADAAQVDALGQTLATKGYVWRDLVAEFVASDAFRSAPAPAVEMK